jgi:beta-N-acetylhexosaminidase
MGIRQNYAPVAGRERNAEKPGHRGPLLLVGPQAGLRPDRGPGPRLRAGRRGSSRDRQALPGHGGHVDDSHTALPTINHTREEWDRIDAPPFKAAIRAGIDTIMTAHIVVPSLDPSGDPAR